MALIGAVGCKQQCFVPECDRDQYKNMHGIPHDLEAMTPPEIQPLAGDAPKPGTVDDPDRPIRYLSLSEAVAIALEHGTVGSLSPTNPGFANDALLNFSLTSTNGDDSIRAFALDPAAIETNIESSLSKFDARWLTSLSWSNTDEPIGTAAQTVQAQANRSNASVVELNDATLSTGLVKPLPAGGVAGITFATSYELSNLNPRVNPSYTPTLQFSFEQPLLQGFGVEINQLRSTHPGSLLTPYTNSSRTEGILITRVRLDQQRAQFETYVNYMLLNVEVAYWNLYDAYWTLYSREQAMRQAFEAWRINKARFEAGKIAIQDFAQSRGQYELFRGQRITAVGQVLENERQLRGLLGMPVEDGNRLVPVDQATVSPMNPDWATALNEAVTLRPELVLARQDLKFRQLDLINQKNLLLPDLRFTSSYTFNGLGNRLDGAQNFDPTLPPADVNALRSLASGNYANWALGLRGEIPIGFRDAHAAVRQARLNLARSYYVLRSQEDKAQRFLAFEYRRLFEFYAQIQAQRAQRMSYGVQLEARFKEFIAGRGTLDFLLEAQRNWADALRAEYDAISSYNSTIAGFEFAKGTIMMYDNVNIAEGPLPACAQVQAAQHEADRANACVAFQRAVPHPIRKPEECQVPGDMPPPPPDIAGIPQIPTDSAPAVSALLKEKPKIPEINEPMVGAGDTDLMLSISKAAGKSAPAPTPMPAGNSGRMMPVIQGTGPDLGTQP